MSLSYQIYILFYRFFCIIFKKTHFSLLLSKFLVEYLFERMIKLQLQNVCLDDFNDIYDLMEFSFPKSELLGKEVHYQNFQRPDFYGKKYEDEKGLAAFIIGYQEEQYLFLEYFAVRADLRQHGIGSQFLKTLINQESHQNIYLEVELPETEIAKRRIGFYQRQGFLLNTCDYKMPTLDNGYGGCPLYVMSYPNTIKPEDFPNIKESFYKKIYRV